MTIEETNVPLDAEFDALLREQARKIGIEPAELAEKLIRDELRKRTAPNAPRGKVKPFRARP